MRTENWKQLVGFILLAVPGTLLLTHIVSMGIRFVRFLFSAPPAEVPSPVFHEPGYGTVEEFRKDAEELPVDDVLSRCRGSAPRNVLLEEKRKYLGATESDSATEFVVGRWYRTRMGHLVVFMEAAQCPRGFGRFRGWGEERPFLLAYSEIVPAVPKQGEWWTSRGGCHCTHANVLNETVLVDEHMACVRDTNEAMSRVSCGCLFPVNFGKGPETGVKAAGGQDRDPVARITGITMLGGNAGIQACPNCRGIGRLVFQFGGSEVCATCKGSGRKA